MNEPDAGVVKNELGVGPMPDPRGLPGTARLVKQLRKKHQKRAAAVREARLQQSKTRWHCEEWGGPG